MARYGATPPMVAVSVAGGAAVAAVVARAGAPWAASAAGWFAVCAVALTFVDAWVSRLPDPLTGAALGGVLALLAVAAVTGHANGQFVRAALAGLALCGFYLLLFVIRPSGMGLGDVKFAASVGAVLGWYGWDRVAAATFLTFIAAALYGIALLVARRATRTTQFPLGPFIVLGALAALLA